MVRDYTTAEIELPLWYSLKILFPLRINGLHKHQLHQCTLRIILPAMPSITMTPAFQRKGIACKQSACPHPSINLGTKCGPNLFTWSVMHLIVNIKSAGLTTDNYSHPNTTWNSPGSAAHRELVCSSCIWSPQASSVSSSASFGLGEVEHYSHSLALLEQAWSLF